MDIKLQQDTACKEVKVCITYAEMDQSVERLYKLVKSYGKSIKCNLDNTEVWVSASDIYYIESIDKRTYVYCEKEVYQCELRLYQVLEELQEFEFVQVSKSSILNVKTLKRIRPLINSRMEATLSNGEKINVTRKYVSAIKQKLMER
jgi:DNA-binding LytR/AlgR family response regulator